MDATLKELREEDGGNFYCPNGHGQKFKTSLSDRLNETGEELKEAKAELLEMQNEVRRLKCALLAKPQQPNPPPKESFFKRLFR